VRLWTSVASAITAGVIAFVVYLLRRPKRIAHALIVTADEHTVYDGECGVRSVQEADLILPDTELDRIWNPRDLERLARTYWRWLTRATFWTVRIDYQPHGRQVKLFGLIPLLTFQEPEYEMDGDRGIVRWRIERGILVAKRGRAGAGYLEIEVRLLPCDVPRKGRVNVEVEVANFYPMIASRLGRFFYTNTQSRIHVIVTHGFLRRIAKRNLEESVTGRFRVPPPDETPAPRRARLRA